MGSFKPEPPGASCPLHLHWPLAAPLFCLLADLLNCRHCSVDFLAPLFWFPCWFHYPASPVCSVSVCQVSVSVLSVLLFCYILFYFGSIISFALFPVLLSLSCLLGFDWSCVSLTWCSCISDYYFCLKPVLLFLEFLNLSKVLFIIHFKIIIKFIFDSENILQNFTQY